MAYPSIDLMANRAARQAARTTDFELDHIIANAARAFEHWRLTKFSTRVNVLAKAATIMRTHMDHFAQTIAAEMGKRIEQARGEVALRADIIDYYAKNAARILPQDRITPAPARVSATRIRQAPDFAGILFAGEAWNFPYYQLARFAAPNLLAGNVVLVQRAVQASGCALAFEELWRAAGAPFGTYANLDLSEDQQHRLQDDPRVKVVKLIAHAESFHLAAAETTANTSREESVSVIRQLSKRSVEATDEPDFNQVGEWPAWGKSHDTDQ
jgi:succinate-semialdehyde dehydrogenase / glutarate-semialdehyde dehydrogenase